MDSFWEIFHFSALCFPFKLCCVIVHLVGNFCFTNAFGFYTVPASVKIRATLKRLRKSQKLSPSRRTWRIPWLLAPVLDCGQHSQFPSRAFHSRATGTRVCQEARSGNPRRNSGEDSAEEYLSTYSASKNGRRDQLNLMWWKKKNEREGAADTPACSANLGGWCGWGSIGVAEGSLNWIVNRLPLRNMRGIYQKRCHRSRPRWRWEKFLPELAASLNWHHCFRLTKQHLLLWHSTVDLLNIEYC